MGKQETVPIKEVPLEEQRDIVLRHLDLEREVWLPLHARAERAGGHSAEANLAEANEMKRIDALLEALTDIALAESLELQL